jgi:hypothetical protein
VSLSRPVGRSTASVGALLAFMRAIQSASAPSAGRCLPRPSRASIQRSCALNPSGGERPALTPAARARRNEALVSAGAVRGSPSQVTTTRRPAWCRCMAASRPSPPLLPGPQAIHTVRAWGAQAMASRATDRPARCIRVWGGRWRAAAASMPRTALLAKRGCGRW